MAFRPAHPRPKSDKLRLNLHGTILEGKPIGSKPKIELIRRAHDLNNQDANSRIQLTSNESKLVPKNLEPGAWSLEPKP